MKRIFALILCIALLSILPTSALAHPGKTDSSGGHTDRSTGEYHYHHGYEAHSHYDVDGDGDIDCPYDFVDKTDHSPGSGSDSSFKSSPGTYSNSSSDSYANSSVSKKNDSPDGEVKKVPAWVYWTFAVLITSIFILWLSNRSKKSEISDLQKRQDWLLEKHQKELTSQKEHFNNELSNQRTRLHQEKEHAVSCVKSQLSYKDQQIAQLNAENRSLASNLHAVISTVESGQLYFPTNQSTDQSLYQIQIPDDVYFTEDFTPVKGQIFSFAPYGDFTVYISPRGKKYHIDEFCGGSILKPVHIFDVIESREPCYKCSLSSNYATQRKVPDWYKEAKQVSKKCKQTKEIIEISPPVQVPDKEVAEVTESSYILNNKELLYGENVSIDQLEFAALEMGISLSVAKRLINLERRSVGSPPI